MKFKRCQIGGVEYGDDEKVNSASSEHKPKYFQDEFEDMNILRDLSDGKVNFLH